MEPQKILVTSDSNLIHNILEVLLQHYSPLHGNYVPDALQVLVREADIIDLIVLDINMPSARSS